MREVRHWSMLPKEAVVAPSLDIQGQAGWPFRHLEVVEGCPSTQQGIGSESSLMSLPAQTIL